MNTRSYDTTGKLLATIAVEGADVVTRDGRGTETARRPATAAELFVPPLALSPDQQLAALTALATRSVVEAAAADPKPWAQPLGAHDAYPAGMVVLGTDGHRYRNDLGWNVWGLDVAAAKWTDLDAVVPDGPQPWKEWDGIVAPYMKGALVTFEGETYKSTVDNNTWSPTEYGWVVAP